MAEPRRDLRLVDPETGEILNRCPQCGEFEKQLAGAEKEIRAWRTRYANLKADKDAEAKAHGLWGWAVALFQEWKQATNHMRSGWNAERFWLCQPYLEQDGFVVCRWAVWGIALMPMTKTLSTGLVERYDSFELCFRTRAHFERNVNRGRSHPIAKKWYGERPEQAI